MAIVKHLRSITQYLEINEKTDRNYKKGPKDILEPKSTITERCVDVRVCEREDMHVYAPLCGNFAIFIRGGLSLAWNFGSSATMYECGT